MPPTVSIPPQPVETTLERLRQRSERMGRPGCQGLQPKCVPKGVSQGGNTKSSSTLQSKSGSRFLENSMSDSQQDTSRATEGPLAELAFEYKNGMRMDADKRGPLSTPTPKSVGAGVMRGKSLRSEDLKIDGFPRSLPKFRGMDSKSRTADQSPMLSFRSLLEGAISASGTQPPAPVHSFAEPHMQGELSFSGDKVRDRMPYVSYSSLLQAQLGDDPIEVRADPSCKTAGTSRLNVGAHFPPVQLQLHPTKVEGGFLALLNETTRLLAPVAQRPTSPRADFVSNGGRISGVRFSDKLLQDVARDVSRSADAVPERDGSDLPRASAVPAIAVLPRAVGDGPQAEAVVERRSPRVADSLYSDEDASSTSLRGECGGGPFAVNESLSAEILSDGVAVDFSETARVAASPVLTKTEEDVSPAAFVVTDAASREDEMTDAQLVEELSRRLALEESTFEENASNMGAVDSSEAASAAAALTSPVLTRTQQSVPREEVAVAGCVYIDEKALDVERPEEPSGPFGADESRSARKVSKGNIFDWPEASAAPDVRVSGTPGEIAVPGGVGRTSCAVPGLISGAETASRVQPAKEVPQALALEESLCAEIVPERNAHDSSGAAAAAMSPVVVRREEDVGLVEMAGSGSVDNDEEMADVFESEEASQAVGVDELGNTETLKEEIARTVSEAAAEAASLVPVRRRDNTRLPEALMEKEVGLCGDAVVHSEWGKDHPLSCIRSDVEVSDEKTKYPSRDLETGKPCAGGLDGVTDVGITLASSWQAGLKQLGDGGGDSVGAETILEWSCKAGSKEMEDVDSDGVVLREENLCEGQRSFELENVFETGEKLSSVRPELIERYEVKIFPAEAVVERRRPLVADSTCAVDETLDAQLPEDDDEALLVNELQSVDVLSEIAAMDSREVNAILASHVPSSIEEADSPAKLVVDPITAVVTDSVSKDEQMLDVELFEELTEALGGSVPLPAEGVFEPIDEGAVVGREREDNNCHIKLREDLIGQNAGGKDRLIGSHCRSGPQMSCIGFVEMAPTTVFQHANGNPLVAERIHTDGRDQMMDLTEEKVGEEPILACRGKSNEVVTQLEAEHHQVDDFAERACAVQRVIFPSSESRAGFVANEIGYESEQVSPSELVGVKPDFRNEGERVSEEQVATDSGNSGVPGGQASSPDPDASSKALRQTFLLDSDATVSGLLESVQVSGAELGVSNGAGKEVQSPMGRKLKNRHNRHVDDLEDRRYTDDLTTRRIGHLDKLENNGSQPYVSPSNVIMDDQLVRPPKKRGRSRTNTLNKALHEIEKPRLLPSASKGNRQSQNTSSRCRRNLHINPDQPVLVLVEGRDEGFEDADCGAFCRWLTYQDKGNPALSTAVRKRARKHDQELVKSMIATPSFRVVPEYDDIQKIVEKRRKVVMEQYRGTRETLMSSRTVHASDYDMDDEDERWLLVWNKRLAWRGIQQPISEDKFEEIIEYFEKMYAQMEAASVEDFSGCQKTSASCVPRGPLPSTFPSGLDCLSTSPGVPVSENAPALNPSRVRSGHPPWTGGLNDAWSSEKQVVVRSAIRVDSIGGESASPAGTVLFHTLNSESERNMLKSVGDIVTENPVESSLQKSFKPLTKQRPSYYCCICNGGEDDENNLVYTCKRCLIHVHQSCYGILEKSRDAMGQIVAPSSWCCRKCEAVAVGMAQPKVSCALCRKRGGALKPTVVPRKWAHVACALYTNETFFVDPDAMEPIDGITAAARAQDRQDRCGLCGMKRGICSLCSVNNCGAPFHVSCGVSHGASFELRQSNQKVVRVHSFCPLHAHTTPTNSGFSAGLKEGHMASNTTSGATASATASGSISTASPMDHRIEWPSGQNTSCGDGNFAESARQATNVGTFVSDLTDNVVSRIGKGTEDAGRGRPNHLRFTVKRRWEDSCTQVSEDGVSIGLQKNSGNGRGVVGDKFKDPGCKSMWRVVELGQKLKKIKFKFGTRAQNRAPESSLTIFQQEGIECQEPEAEKVQEVMPAIYEASGDASEMFVNGLSEDRFAKELKELTILEQAMKSGVAPEHIMREAFVYWRAKRAGHKGFLLCELNHKRLSKSQGIFKIPGDPRNMGNLPNEKMASPVRIPLAQQLSSECTEKMLEKAKELRTQLDRVRAMAQTVIQREKLKYKQQLVQMTIASAELNMAECKSEEPRCVWCRSTRTLLNCGTCPRSFCFNCFKNRKGFGVQGWMAAMKLPMYSCKYCLELLKTVADLSNNLDLGPKETVNVGLVSNQAVPSEPLDAVIRTSTITSNPAEESREKGGSEEQGLQGFDSPDPAPLRRVEGGVVGSAIKSLNVNEVRSARLGIGRGKGNRWTVVSDDARPGLARFGSKNGENNQSKPSQFGLDKFLSITDDQMEHSSFETTLRRLKILRRTNTDANQEPTMTAEISPGNRTVETADVRASRPVITGLESGKRGATDGGIVSVLVSPASGPALLVYKKNRRLILGANSEPPSSAYNFTDVLNHPPSSPTGLRNGPSERPVGLLPSS